MSLIYVWKLCHIFYVRGHEVTGVSDQRARRTFQVKSSSLLLSFECRECKGKPALSSSTPHLLTADVTVTSLSSTNRLQVSEPPRCISGGDERIMCLGSFPLTYPPQVVCHLRGLSVTLKEGRREDVEVYEPLWSDLSRVAGGADVNGRRVDPIWRTRLNRESFDAAGEEVEERSDVSDGHGRKIKQQNLSDTSPYQ